MADDDWHRHRAGFVYRSPDSWTAVGNVVRTRRRGVVISDVAIQGPADEDGAPGAVTSTALREIPTGEIVAAAMASGHLPEYEYTQPVAPVEPKRQPGRQPLSSELLQDVALRYIAESLPGRPRGTVQRLAEHYDKPVQTISRWVMRARRDAWLGPAVPGREGGEPGQRLIAEVGPGAIGEAISEMLREIGAAEATVVDQEQGPGIADAFRQTGASETDRPFPGPSR